MAKKSVILQNAQKFMAKGKIDKAIEEWQKLITDSPNDGNIYNTIGDLYLKDKKLPKATEAFLKGANAFHSAGFALKAMAVYKKLTKLVPDRVDILTKLADLNAERGMASIAIQDYLAAAKKYTQENDIKGALDVYRKVAALDESNTSIRIKLAEMCLKEGYRELAIEEFVKLAVYYKNNNQSKELETIQEHILKLDPNNLTILQMKGKTAPAAEAPSSTEVPTPEKLLAQVDDLIGKENYDEAGKLIDQCLETDPEDAAAHQKKGTILLKTKTPGEAFESLKKACQIYISRTEYGLAGKLMKDFLDADPERIEAYQLLGEAYEKSGNAKLAVSAYAHIIDEHLASGDMGAGNELFLKIKALDPEHRDVRRLKHTFDHVGIAKAKLEISQSNATLSLSQSDSVQAASPPVEGPGTGIESSVEEQKPPMETVPAQEILDESVGSTVEAPDVVVEPEPEPVDAPAADPAALQSCFTEAEVYIKYGMTDKAIDQLKQAVAMDPENPEAHEQLKAIYKTEGQKEEEVEACLKLIEIYKNTGDSERRKIMGEEAKALDPENPRVMEATGMAPILQDERMEELLKEKPVQDINPVTQESTVNLEPAVEEPVSSPELPDESAPEMEGEEEEDIEERVSEAEFYYQQGLQDEAKKMYELILALKPDHPTAAEKLNLIIKEQEESLTVVSDPPAQVAPEVAAPAPSEDLAEKSDVEKEDEKTLNEELDKSFAAFTGPGETESEPVNAGVDQKSVPREEVAGGKTENVEIKDDEYVDLSMLLDDESRAILEVSISKDAPVAGDLGDADENINAQLDSLFSEFEHDAVEQSDDIDVETHYNLGIAYKEMGLINEAILEFQESIKGSDRFIDSSSMLGVCLQESGNSSEAVQVLKQALGDSRCDETQRRWLMYDLAVSYEIEERFEEAHAQFNDIYESDRNFRDVAERLHILQDRLGKSKQEIQVTTDHASEDEDVDAMMDRIFGESSLSGNSEKNESGAGEDKEKKDKISFL